jgi:predicted lipoprotein with Yx(FWY)xxD motif
MNRKVTPLIAAAATFAIALLAAGCGSSASGSPYSSGGYGSSSAASATRSVAATVGVGRTSLGRVIVDSKGRTLYLFEKDTARRSTCSGQCAHYWPPLLTHGAPVARAGVKQSLGSIARAGGSRQVTYAGHPLYRYVGDSKPGQTNGEGSQEFGAGWDALSPAGKKIESDDG